MIPNKLFFIEDWEVKEAKPYDYFISKSKTIATVDIKGPTLYSIIDPEKGEQIVTGELIDLEYGKDFMLTRREALELLLKKLRLEIDKHQKEQEKLLYRVIETQSELNNFPRGQASIYDCG